MWPEVQVAKKENRHELVLAGAEVSRKISEDGLDAEIFNITNLNYLDIHETSLTEIPGSIGKLNNLQTLVLHSNKLERIPMEMVSLQKLKVLDVSRNSLKALPEELTTLLQLTTLNASCNQLEKFPTFTKNQKLAILDISNNKLNEFPDVCYAEMLNLAELKLQGNEIELISDSICNLPALKVFDVSFNKVKIVPRELADCSKLKEVNLKSNPISDKRLLKLIDQCRTKQVIDYVKLHCTSGSTQNDNKTSKKNKKGTQSKKEKELEANKDAEYKHRIKVVHSSDDSLKIILKDDVKAVRAHIVACLVSNITFTEETFKKFIQLQTKFHDTLCEKRNAATIATHDHKKIGPGDLTYTAIAPNELNIQPLNRPNSMSGADLFTRLQAEADALRREKKRNVYSGIHKYLYLLEGQSKYPCLLNVNGAVISFPPITNSDITKMALDTTDLLIEVTSASSQQICKKILDTLLKEMVMLLGIDLTVQQVRNTDIDGNLKSVYPARTDLVYDDNASIAVIRE